MRSQIYVAILCGHFQELAAQDFCVRKVGEFPKHVWIPRANQIAGCLPLHPSPTDRNLPIFGPQVYRTGPLVITHVSPSMRLSCSPVCLSVSYNIPQKAL